MGASGGAGGAVGGRVWAGEGVMGSKVGEMGERE